MEQAEWQNLWQSGIFYKEIYYTFCDIVSFDDKTHQLGEPRKKKQFSLCNKSEVANNSAITPYRPINTVYFVSKKSKTSYFPNTMLNSRSGVCLCQIRMFPWWSICISWCDLHMTCSSIHYIISRMSNCCVIMGYPQLAAWLASQARYMV